MMNDPRPNENKNLTIEIGGKKYARFPIQTSLITDQDNIVDIVKHYTDGLIKPGDYIFISERVIAVTQKRAFLIDEIKPSFWANFLVRFVHKSPYGIGLGSPWTMELAIKEAGLPRIIFAGIISALVKPFGLKGIFYKIAGNGINAIDGPCDYTIPPFNKYATLGPADPDRVAKEVSGTVGVPVVVIDANDLGVEVLGRSDESVSKDFCRAVFKDNPLGQERQQTPVAIVREVE